MKVLKFLVAGCFDQLNQMLVKYLIDCGHFVEIVENDDALDWMEFATHNIRTIKQQDLDYLKYDFVIDIYQLLNDYTTPQIIFGFNTIGNIASINIGLKRGDKFVSLIDGKTEYDKNNRLSAELDHLFSEITELFIDALIILLRTNINELIFKPDGWIKDNQFAELILVEEQLQDLHQYYQDVESNDTKFKLNSKAIVKNLAYSQFNSKAYKFTQQQLEFFTLYLLVLFNARNSALYSYDLSIVDGTITKYIDFDVSNNYEQLDKAINNPRYAIIHSPLYRTHGFNDFITETEVHFSNNYKESTSSSNRALIINYSLETQELNIKYHENLYFFSQLDVFLDDYFAKFNELKSANAPFDMLLYHKEEYFVNQLKVWNNTKRDYPNTATVHDLFAQYAAEIPNNVAIHFANREYTYAELNTKSNQLAYYLVKQYSIKPDDLIGLCIDKSEYLPVALLAILKSGAGYVPMDYSYPRERIGHILSDSKPKVVLLNEHHANLINSIGVEYKLSLNTIAIDNPDLNLNTYPNTNLSTTATASSLAYIIYTSGTTGKPKGVMVEQHNIVSLVKNTNYVNITADDVFILLSDIAFDAATFEIWGALLNGAQLVIPEDTQKLVADIAVLKQILYSKKISIIWLTKTLFDTLYLQDPQLFANIKYLLVGGKALDYLLIDKLSTSNDRPKHIINGYGPTENTTFSCTYEINDLSGLQSVPIGKPLSNRSAFVLDYKCRMLPIGAIGELYLSGAGLARGYLNHPQLTQEKFLPNPYKQVCTSVIDKLYKTGDLVRYLTDGNIEYIGRNDSQVKIRGYRIELSEIEMVLASYNGVRQNIVIAKDHLDYNGNLISKYLVAYYVADNPIDEQMLYDFLEQHIPDYMIPNRFINVAQFPLTANGKVNTRALPEAEISNLNNYVAPRNEVEQQLCSIWATVLGVPEAQFGIYDDFFKLGGNSILAIKLIYQINRALNKNIEIKTLYEARNVALFALQLETEEFAFTEFQLKADTSVKLYEPFQMSNVQQAYAIGRAQNNILGNVATHVYYEVVYSKLDKIRLEAAINKLIQRHVILKSKFTNDLKQMICEQDIFYKVVEFICKDYSELQVIRNNMSQEIISYEQIPLFNIAVSRLEYLDDKYIVHYSFDALLLDVASIRIFIQELDVFYSDLDAQLPPLLINFKDYRAQIDKINQTELYKKDKQYWENKLENYNFEFGLPLRCEPGEIDLPKFARIEKIIDSKIWQKVVDKAQKNGISLTAVILMVYGKTLAFWSGQEKVCINLTLFNRLPLHEQVNSIMGDFTILELFNYCENLKDTVKNHIQTIHDNLWSDIKHNLFDGIDCIRLVRQLNEFAQDTNIAPIVLTSILGEEFSWVPSLGNAKPHINFMTAQTPQVWIDNKAYEIPEGFMAEWDYVEQLFDYSTIKAMHEHYCLLIEYLATADWECDSLLQLQLPPKDLEIINQANNTDRKYETDTLFGYYFKNIIRNDMGINIAIIDEGNGVSYTHKQLLEDSKLLSQYILSIQNKSSIKQPSKLVAILCEKGCNQVVGILAIMQAGFGYLPLNVDWPLGRLDDILKQGEIQIVLISKQQAENPNVKQQLAGKYQLLVIEDIFEGANDELRQTLSTIHLPIVNTDDIAYVIFTSGSTGIPKGVTISHKGALNTILAVNEKYQVNASDKIFALSELSFDLSVYDIFGLLSVGGAIIFPKQGKTKEPSYWVELVNKHKITIWNTVPQLAGLFIDSASSSDLYVASLRLFLLSGDWIPTGLPDKIKGICHKAVIVALGGATEGSIWSIWYEIEKVDSSWSKIPYGYAMPNQKMYILNYNLEHCPINVLGEIYIGGDGVALNYYRDESKTRASYIQHNSLVRIYKTGDQGRWSWNGYIEFAGRIDNQVKINGYRVELEEISAKLKQLPGVEEAFAHVIKNDGRNYVYGYLLPKQDINKITNDAAFNPEEFKFLQIGVRKDLQSGFAIDAKLDETEFKLRKSYRNFINHTGFNYNEIESHINLGKKILSSYLNNKSCDDHLSITQLFGLLSQLSCIQLKDRALPKYRYPSAGGSYSVRCYVTINQELDNLPCGCYYYNPLIKSLCKSNEYKNKMSDAPFSLSLVAYWDAIEPLYNKESRKLVYLEAGHMLALLLIELNQHGLPFAICCCDEKNDNSNTVLARLDLFPNKKLASYLNPTVEISCCIRKDNIYQDQKGEMIDISTNSIFVQANAYSGRLLANGSGLINVYGESNIDNLIYSGMLFQILSSKLYEHDIGSCMLGFKLGFDELYSMVIGKTDKAEQEKSESNLKDKDLVALINGYIGKNLPEYMLPYGYILLDTIPLTANGKLDIKKLPLPEIGESSDHYVAPRSELESGLCALFAEVLKINVDRVGITDEFFRLGGNSLLAMQMLGLFAQRFNIKLTLQQLYKYKTIQSLIDNGLGNSKADLNKVVTYHKVSVENRSYELSAIQQGIYLQSKLDAASNTYNVPLFIKVSDVDLDLLEVAILNTFARHEILRMTVTEGMHYTILDIGKFKVIRSQIKQSALKNYIAKQGKHLFNLDGGILICSELISVANSSDVILNLTHHHILSDAYSLVLLFSEVLNEYSDLKNSNGSQSTTKAVDADVINYFDFANYQAKELTSPRYEEAIKHLADKLSNSSPIGLKRISNDKLDNIGADFNFRLEHKVLEKLEALSIEYNISVYSILLTSLYHVLGVFNVNEGNFPIILTVSTRPFDLNKAIGPFINTLPLVFDYSKDDSYLSNIQKVHDGVIYINEYQYINLNILAQKIDKNVVNLENLMQILFTLHNFNEAENTIKLNYEDISTHEVAERFGISITGIMEHDGIYFHVNYAKNLYTLEYVEGIFDCFVNVLTELNNNSLNQKISNLNLLTGKKYNEIVNDWNNTDKVFPDRLVQELFEEQVKVAPDNIAVVYENSRLTYAELNEKANRFAHYLRDNYDINPDDLCALCLDRSDLMLIAILGVLKSGGAYVPIDPGYPDDRIEFILKDTQAKILITNEIYLQRLKDINASIEIFIIENHHELSTLTTNPPIVTNSSNLAYVIYTSGTTGKPKGVMIEQRNVINYLFNLEAKQLPVNNIDFSSNLAFDLSVTTTLYPLCFGKTIFPFNGSLAEVDRFIQHIKNNKIDLVKSTPTFLSSISGAFDNDYKLKYSIVGGEKLEESKCRNILSYCSTIIDEYGPTEATVGTTVFEINNHVKSFNIGKCYYNYKTYVLDENKAVLPVGAVGELYIGGSGVARGYLSRPELTTERFIQNQFQSEAEKNQCKNSRLYKTGDLVSYLPDGKLEYFGRNDFQIKIRGFRVELGEIENALKEHGDINEAVVIAKNNSIGNAMLVAYIVASEFVPTDIEVKEFLEESLPQYMIPEHYIFLDKLPLTINGKLDRNALPDPELLHGENHVAPRNELEEKMCDIYAEILGVTADKIGINDSFFKLGGDSILAIRLVSKLNTSCNASLSVRDVFIHKTIESLVEVCHLNPVKEVVNKYVKFGLLDESYKSDIPLEDAFPASYLQTGMLYESELDQRGAYTDVMGYKIQTNFNHKKLINIWQKLVTKHGLLRARFVSHQEYGFVVEIAKHIDVSCTIFEQQNIDKLMDEQRLCGFQFNQFGLFRLTINKYPNDFDLIFSFHHAILDGWSMASLINEFIEVYVDDKQLIEEVSDLYYGEFVAREQLEIHNNEKIDFWKNYLAEVELTTVKWNFGQKLSANGILEANHILTESECMKLHNRIQQLGVSADSLFLHAYLATLSRFLNNSDVTVGLVVNNRSETEGGDKLLGLFLNTIPFRYNLGDTTQSIDIFNEKVKLYEYKDVPYGFIKSLIGYDLYNFAFNYINFHILDDSWKSIGQVNVFEKTNIPFLLNVSQRGENNIVIWVTAHDEFIDQEFLDYFLSYMRANLNSIINGDEKLLSILPQDYEKLINDWNKTEITYPNNKVIQEIFEEQVQKTPDHVAVVYENSRLTYAELNQKANQLAHYLINTYKIKGDDLVALCFNRSELMLIAILGVLKAGGAYVPIDPNYPTDRVEYILEDSNVNLIITNTVYQEMLVQLNKHIKIFDIDSNQSKLNQNDVTNPPLAITSNNLAYIIYTSGTTGKPKGVMIEHSSVINTIYSLNEVYDISIGSRVTAFTAYVFDVSVSEIFTPLFHGAELHIFSESIRTDAGLISDYLIKNKINYTYLPPILLSALPKINYTELQGIIYAGEPCDFETGKYWSNKTHLFNYYGPTETTIYATGKEVKNGDTNLIGRPIGNTTAYVLDKNLSPLPICVIGELYIGGVGLARGYLNKPELTEKVFLDNPFQNTNDKLNGKNSKIYKTGDLVRWTIDGNLEYFGRNDFQVKIRGFRIELGEIESKLSSYAGIKQAIVLAKEHKNSQGHSTGNKYLVAYYIADSALDHNKILSYLETMLPEYMVPSVLVHLEQLPLTINGKLDRKALPEPEFKSESAYVAPETELESRLCSIWQEVLGIQKVGIQDNFFKIGGDSILSIQLLAKLRNNGFECSIKGISENKTVALLAKYLESATNNIKIEAEQGELSGKFGFLPIQKWFFESKFINQNHWNQSFLIKVPELDIVTLEQAIVQLVKHHDILRVTFKDDYQEYTNGLPIPSLNILDCKALKDNQLGDVLTSWQSNFDLKSGYLWQLGYIHGYKDNSARIFFAFHHLIVDAVSWRILTEDLQSLYHNNSLSKKTSSYRQWVATINNYANAHISELDYWQEQILNQAQFYPLVTDGITTYKISFSKKITNDLLQKANAAYHTEINDLLLTALAYALNSWTQQQINHITLEGHGREHIDDKIEVNRTVGWFTTMYPVKLQVTTDYSSSIKSIKENLRRIPTKGLGYSALKYASNTVSLKEHKLPPIIFNYLGQFIEHTDKSWHILNEDSGISMSRENHEYNILNINGMIIAGELQFGIQSKLELESGKEFVKHFEQHLKAIIEYCLKVVNSNEVEFTPHDFQNVTISSKFLDNLQKQHKIQTILPLNAYQKEVFYVSNLNKNYQIEVVILQIKHVLNKETIQKYISSWHKAVNAHFCMRSLFCRENNDNSPISIVLPQYTPEIKIYECTNYEAMTPMLEKEQEKCSRLGESTPPYRLAIFICKDTCYLSFTFHHIMLCGFSILKILTDVDKFYLEPDAQVIESLPIAIINKRENSKKFWQSYLASFEFSVRDPTPYPSPWRIDRFHLKISGEDFTAITKIRDRLPCTIAEYFQYAWAKCLSEVYKKSDVLFAMTCSIRSELNVEPDKLIGAFIATPPFRWNFEQQKTLMEQLQLVNQENIKRNEHASYDFFPESFFATNMVETLFVFQNYAKSGAQKLYLHDAKMNFSGSDYKMCLNISEGEDSFDIFSFYNYEYYNKETVQLIMNQYKAILGQELPNMLLKE